MSRSVLEKSLNKLNRMLDEEDGKLDKMGGGGRGVSIPYGPVYGSGLIASPGVFGAGPVYGAGPMYGAGPGYVAGVRIAGVKPKAKKPKAKKPKAPKAGGAKGFSNSQIAAQHNPWIQHVRAVAAANGVSYGAVLNNPELLQAAKASYYQ